MFWNIPYFPGVHADRGPEELPVWGCSAQGSHDCCSLKALHLSATLSGSYSCAHRKWNNWHLAIEPRSTPPPYTKLFLRGMAGGRYLDAENTTVTCRSDVKKDREERGREGKRSRVETRKRECCGRAAPPSPVRLKLIFPSYEATLSPPAPLLPPGGGPLHSCEALHSAAVSDMLMCCTLLLSAFPELHLCL